MMRKLLLQLVTGPTTKCLDYEGNHDGEWIFWRRKEADVTLFLQVTRMTKIIKICKANLTSPKQDDHNGNEP